MTCSFYFLYLVILLNSPDIYCIMPNGLAVAVRWQSTSLSRFQYLSATDSKRLLWAGFWSTLVILCRANKLSTHYL